jgi:hypothetical protein
MVAAAGCALEPSYRSEGPARIRIAERTFLQLPRHLVFLPAEEGTRLMRAMGERPGTEVLGVVVDKALDPPHVLIIFATSRDARGVPEIELVGWDDAPQAKSLIQELLLVQVREFPSPPALIPPAQPPIVLQPAPPPPKKEGETAKLCTRELFVPCADERGKACTRKETYKCD